MKNEFEVRAENYLSENPRCAVLALKNEQGEVVDLKFLDQSNYEAFKVNQNAGTYRTDTSQKFATVWSSGTVIDEDGNLSIDGFDGVTYEFQ